MNYDFGAVNALTPAFADLSAAIFKHVALILNRKPCRHDAERKRGCEGNR
jgi:hypothetical protein